MQYNFGLLRNEKTSDDHDFYFVRIRIIEVALYQNDKDLKWRTKMLPVY